MLVKFSLSHRRPSVSHFFKLFGDWFTLEMVMHYEGKHNLLKPDVCVTIHVNETQLNVLEFSVRNHNKTHVFQEFDYSLKFNGSKPGLWIDSKIIFNIQTKLFITFFIPDSVRNVQVIMLEGNFTVLTFCDKAQLTSFVLSRKKDVNATEVK